MIKIKKIFNKNNKLEETFKSSNYKSSSLSKKTVSLNPLHHSLSIPDYTYTE